MNTLEKIEEMGASIQYNNDDGYWHIQFNHWDCFVFDRLEVLVNKVDAMYEDYKEGITRNEDGSYNIPVDLDHNTIAKLAIEAHEMGITLNDYMIMVVTDYAKKTINEC